MGFIRKTMSISSAGLVDFRSDKERTAAYTKGARKHARKQTRIMRQMADQQQAAASAPAYYSAPTQAPPPPVNVPAGWYSDPNGAPVNRWWDGCAWTASTAPRV